MKRAKTVAVPLIADADLVAVAVSEYLGKQIDFSMQSISATKSSFSLCYFSHVFTPRLYVQVPSSDGSINANVSIEHGIVTDTSKFVGERG